MNLLGRFSRVSRPVSEPTVRPGFATMSHHALTDATEDIELVVDPVSAPSPQLGDTEWRLVELNGEPVEIADARRS